MNTLLQSIPTSEGVRKIGPGEGEKFDIAGAGETLIAPRDIPHQFRNSGDVANHYLIMFSPSGFEEFLRATSVPAPDNAVAPTAAPAVDVRNVFELAAEYGIQFGGKNPKALMRRNSKS
jgi:hypothetical protein